MKTIYEQSKSGLRAVTFAPPECGEFALAPQFTAAALPDLPSVSELGLVRHYTALSKRAFGVDDGFYPLGSCTMKYNPKLNDAAAALSGFDCHPLASPENVQGCLRLIYELSDALACITGTDAVSLQPCAGAHGEYTGLLLIDKYHKSRGDFKRDKIIIPDSAHGTNPASAVMAGFKVVSVGSDSEKGVDIAQLKAAVGDDTAALMLTNPTTLGLFEKNITEISKIVHDAGGLLYYDGANLNAVMNVARPGDMGFDVVHLNLHKTFSAPHGGGGPGSGPVGCKSALKEFLPYPQVRSGKGGFELYRPECSIGKVTSFFGNFGVYVKAYCYIVTLGGKGLRRSAQTAVLNANYLKSLIAPAFSEDSGRCMHEFVLSAEKIREETGVSANDMAKAMIDGGIHPPTVYFPLIVREAMMFEPTETESKETLDEAAELIVRLCETARSNPDFLKNAPRKTCVGRPDEVKAARMPILRD